MVDTMTLPELNSKTASLVHRLVEYKKSVNIRVEAYINTRNGIDNRLKVIDAIYDSNSNTFVIYINGEDVIA